MQNFFQFIENKIDSLPIGGSCYPLNEFWNSNRNQLEIFQFLFKYKSQFSKMIEMQKRERGG